MLKKTIVTIVLRKEVEDAEAAEVIYNLVKQKMAAHPDVRIVGSINTQLIEE